jgi:hypothetical protein
MVQRSGRYAPLPESKSRCAGATKLAKRCPVPSASRYDIDFVGEFSFLQHAKNRRTWLEMLHFAISSFAQNSA